MQIADYPGFLEITPGMSLTALVSAIFNFFLIIAGLAAFIMIVWGGVKYLTSAGDPSKTRDAKKQVFAAILGLIILFSSWMILNTINPNLVNIEKPADLPPSPKIEQPEPPTEPPAETPAAFYYIPLGKIIDDVILQGQEAIPKMKNFANSASGCGNSQCDGGTCSYQVEVCSTPCKTVCEGEENDEETCVEVCETVCSTETITCSAPCSNGDPCPANRTAAVNRVATAAGKMEQEITKLQQAKSKIGECILQEDTIFLSCREALDMFNPDSEGQAIDQWDEIQDCRQGYDFYCLYGAGKTGWLDKIVLPFENVKEGIESSKELSSVIANCNCSNCSFACGECSGACSGTPCSSQTYTASASATEAVNELETRLKKLEETAAEITLMSATDEITTLTCSEAYSWLKSIKGSGCPGVKVFPCCPVDQETEKIIRNCRSVDFFFCAAP